MTMKDSIGYSVVWNSPAFANLGSFPSRLLSDRTFNTLGKVYKLLIFTFRLWTRSEPFSEKFPNARKIGPYFGLTSTHIGGLSQSRYSFSFQELLHKENEIHSQSS